MSFGAIMKTILKLASLLATFASLTMVPSRAAEVSVSFFYDNLDPYGEWVEVGDYGYCWHPRDVDNDWRPYNDGHWVYTDAGWTWVSDEPYGWAVYHYGRWTRAERVGWVWVPDTEWAPAWVSWRRNDRYVGWAPLPPESRVRVGVSLGGWVDAEFDIGPTFYSFVEVRNLGAPRLRSVVLPPRENITIINQTTNITNITYQNNVVINNGPDYNVVSREVEQPIRRLKLDRRGEIADVRTARAGQLGPKVEGESLVVAAPAIQKAPEAKPKKVAQKIEKTAVDRGWKDAGDAKQVETARAKIKEEAKAAPGATAQEPAPPTPPADTTAPAKGERPATAQEPAAPGPETEPATKPGKGKARDRRKAAAEPATPAKPGEPAATTDETAPAKVGTPEQPGVATETRDPVQPGKQRGKKAERRPAPEAIAEDTRIPPERPQAESRPALPERPPNQAERPGRKARDERPDQLDREIRREQEAQRERPAQPERTERPARPERRDVPEQVERSVRERMPARGGGAGPEPRAQRPERAQPPQPQQSRPPQPNVQERGPGAGKAQEGEGKKKKKDEREPE